MPKYYISIDAGATNLKAGLVSNNKIVTLITTPTQTNLGKARVIKNTLSIIDKLSNNHKINGLILAWPGRNNIKVSTEEIKTAIKKQYNVTLIFANDADLFALGETYFGQAKNKNIVLGVTLGTGVGSGLVINKKIYQPQGMTAEFGHTILNHNGPKCTCGNQGCWEQYCGSRGLNRLIKQKKIRANNGQELYNMAIQKNISALNIWKEYGKYLAIGIVSAQKAYNPEIIILGGKISKAWKFFAPSMKQEIKKRYNKKMIIKTSKLDNAAILGGLVLMKNK